MAQMTGSNNINDLIAVRFQSAAAYGLDTIERVLRADIAAHNQIVGEMISEICEVTTDRQRIYGTFADGDMQEVDEYSAAPTQRPITGVTAGFPLRTFQFNIGWTEKYFQRATPADMAQTVLAAELAHLRGIQKEIKKAIFLSANYVFSDFMVDKVDIAVRRFLNADGLNVPNGPNGENFDGATHTHYTASNGWNASALLAAVNNVIEHGHGANVKLAINKGDEAAVRALSGFVAYIDPRLNIPGGATTGVPGVRLDVSRLDNRPIGIFGGAEVWVKPWVPQGYGFAWDAGTPLKPLAFRQEASQALQGLRIMAENRDYPLYARIMEASFGVAAWTRTNGACHYAGGASWTDASF